MFKNIESWLFSKINPVLTPEGPGAVVGVFEKGRVRYWQGFGRQSIAGPPIRPTTLFDLASNAKQFTAALILLLDQEKKLSLDDEVQKFLPQLPRYGRPLRLRHLIYHTSGLRDCGNMEGIADKDHAVYSRKGYLNCAYRQKELNFKTGTRHFYSNTNYILLAEIAARAAGKSFASLVREKLFRPAGMRESLITPLKSLPMSRFALAYFKNEKHWNTCQPDLSDHHAGATGIFSNLPDFNHWIVCLAAGGIGGKKLTARMLSPGRLDDGTPLNYGAGVMPGSLGKHRLISHGGSTAAWTSQYHWLPQSQLLVTCFASHPMINVWKLVPDLTRECLGMRPVLEKASPTRRLPSQQESKSEITWQPPRGHCEGRYWSPEALCGIRIVRKSGKLLLSLLRSDFGQLKPLTILREGRFSLDLFPPSTELDFEGLEQGRASALRLYFGEGSRVFSLRFQRIDG